jgi:hypothetical protein
MRAQQSSRQLGPFRLLAMSIASGPEGHELVVADDGSIPAEQIARLGMRPGTHLRVVAELPPAPDATIAGRLMSWPQVSWEDFERASQLAQGDLGHS